LWGEQSKRKNNGIFSRAGSVGWVSQYLRAHGRGVFGEGPKRRGVIGRNDSEPVNGKKYLRFGERRGSGTGKGISEVIIIYIGGRKAFLLLVKHT